MDTSPKFDEDPSFADLFDFQWWLDQLQAFIVSMDGRQLLGQIQLADIKKARDKATDEDKKERLTQVITYWDYSKAWIEGVTVHDNVDKKDKTLVGMVPIHESLLQVFLDAGWSWGGDWSRAKDYMHFEDNEALQDIQAQAGGQEP